MSVLADTNNTYGVGRILTFNAADSPDGRS